MINVNLHTWTLYTSQCQFTKFLVTHIAFTRSKIQLYHIAQNKKRWSFGKGTCDRKYN